MPPSKAKPPTYDEVAKRADGLRTVTGPVPAMDLVEDMLAARPSQAKNPRQAMRRRLRKAAFDGQGQLVQFLLRCSLACFQIPAAGVSQPRVGYYPDHPAPCRWVFLPTRRVGTPVCTARIRLLITMALLGAGP